tara:strand:- start:1243 stop:2025 length:783 start_codon:yes stop_codon:yes gene_type:complete
MEGNTLSMESNVETTSLDNLSAEEQDSLKVGEQMQEAQDNLLAGKYKSPEELEQGYLELQKKLGQQEETAEPAEDTTEETEGEEENLSILDELWQYESNNEEFHEDAVKELKDMDPVDLAKMHIEYRKQVETGETGGKDFSQQDITELKGIVGGEENYTNMIQWAQGALNETEVNMFDAVMAKGDPLAAFFAVRSLAYAYNDSTGFEGEIVQGKAPRQSNDQFRSQQEVIEAMSDPRYETDSAYRKDIMSKLERSPNVKF